MFEVRGHMMHNFNNPIIGCVRRTTIILTSLLVFFIMIYASVQLIKYKTEVTTDASLLTKLYDNYYIIKVQDLCNTNLNDIYDNFNKFIEANRNISKQIFLDRIYFDGIYNI